MYFSRSFSLILVFALTAHSPTQIFAHHPFEDADVEAASRESDWELRQARMSDIHQRSQNNLQPRSEVILNVAGARSQGVSDRAIIDRLFGGPKFAFPTGTGPLGSRGDRRLLTVLVDFSDTEGELAVEKVEAGILGEGDQNAADFLPFDSVKEYYRRASQGSLTLGGKVVDWVTLDNPRDFYRPSGNTLEDDQKALLKLFTEALQKIDDTTDFSEFDNDNDGDIDGLVVMYAGEPGSWSDFFWAYRWRFWIQEAQDVEFDGKTLDQFVFQFVQTRTSGEYEPKVLIHEVGHLLGLNDYYDYCPQHRFVDGDCPPGILNAGPDGGVGDFDMMDGNWGNHNAYSRWLLDWISPLVLGAGTHQVDLRASGLDGPRTDPMDAHDAVAIFPALSAVTDSAAPGTEMFIVEYRSPVGNDITVPGEGGLVVWHLAAKGTDGPLNTSFDNSFTTPKQLRFVRSENSQDFGEFDAARPEDFYDSDSAFGPDTVPPSLSHNGTHTGVKIENIQLNGDTARLTISVEQLVVGENTGVVTPPMALGASVTTAEPVLIGDPELTSVENLLRFERELSDLSANQLEALWNENNLAIDDEATREQALKAQMLLVKWAQKDGVAALGALETSSDSVKFATQPIIDDALRAFAASQPLAAGDAFLDQDDQMIRTLVVESGSYDVIQTMFASRGYFGDEALAEELGQLKDSAEAFSAIRGLRGAGVEIDRFSRIEEHVAADRETAISSAIELERSIENFTSEFDFDLAPEIGQSVLESLIEQHELRSQFR